MENLKQRKRKMEKNLKQKTIKSIEWEDATDLLTEHGQVCDCYINIEFTDGTTITITPDVDGDFNQVLFGDVFENAVYIYDDEGELIVSEQVYNRIREIQDEIFEKTNITTKK